ncbi:MAG: hypothetical protein ACREDF_06705, partial [Thermoplasmata archaeon]
MARPRQKPEPPAVVSTQLKDAIATLDRSGAAQWFFFIRRRKGNQPLWACWKRKLPVDEVDDVADFCYKQGGPNYEYRIEVVDGDARRASVNGTEIAPRVIPALQEDEIDDSGSSLPASVKQDPLLSEKRRQLDLERARLDLERQEALLDREKKRIDKLRDGEEDEEEEDDGRYYRYSYPPHYGYGQPSLSQPYGYQQPWWMQQQQQQQQPQKSGGDLLALVQIVMSGLEKISSQFQSKSSPLDDIVKLKTILGGNEIGPKEYLSMFSPIMTEMGKVSVDANRVIMENLADSDRAFRERVLDLVMASGAGDDDIERWKKILGLVTDAAAQGIKMVLGRNTITKGE